MRHGGTHMVKTLSAGCRTREEKVNCIEALCISHADALGVQARAEVQGQVLHPALPVRQEHASHGVLGPQASPEMPYSRINTSLVNVETVVGVVCAGKVTEHVCEGCGAHAARALPAIHIMWPHL